MFRGGRMPLPPVKGSLRIARRSLCAGTPGGAAGPRPRLARGAVAPGCSTGCWPARHGTAAAAVHRLVASRPRSGCCHCNQGPQRCSQEIGAADLQLALLAPLYCRALALCSPAVPRPISLCERPFVQGAPPDPHPHNSRVATIAPAPACIPKPAAGAGPALLCVFFARLVQT